MYNNPYMPFNGFNGFMPQVEKQQPIQNIINTATQNQNTEFFMAKFLNPNENINNIYINNKTAFIDLTNKKLTIKEPGKEDVKEYELVVPKDEKDLKIEQQDMQIATLQEQINLLKEKIENDKSNVFISPSDASTQQVGDAKKLRSK